MNQTQLHIIVPAYNAGKYLDRCIRSVTAQNHENWRMVIVDDGSSDDTGAIAGAAADRDKRITVLRQENGGQISARDAGITYALSNSDPDAYLLFLDADDELKPGALTRIAQLIGQHWCDMLVYGIERYDASADRVYGTLGGSAEGEVSSKSQLYKIVLFDIGYNSLCRKAIAKKVFSTSDYKAYTDLRYGEDLIQSLDYYRGVKSVYFTREILYRYHFNPASMTRTIDLRSYPIDSTVRRLTWEFVVAENVWTQDELNDYARFLLELLENKLVALSCFRAPYQDKAEIFDAVLSDPFYAMLLDRKLAHSRIITLLQKRQYRSLIAAAKLKKIARRLR